MFDYTNPQPITDGDYSLDDVKRDLDHFANNFTFCTTDKNDNPVELTNDFFDNVHAAFGHLDPNIVNNLTHAAQACLYKFSEIMTTSSENDDSEEINRTITALCAILTNEHTIRNTTLRYNHFFDGYIHPDINFSISFDIERSIIIINNLDFPITNASISNPRYERYELYSRYEHYEGPLAPSYNEEFATPSPRIDAANKKIDNARTMITTYLDRGGDISYDIEYLITVNIDGSYNNVETYKFYFSNQYESDITMKKIKAGILDNTPVIISDTQLKKTHIFNPLSIISAEESMVKNILDNNGNIITYFEVV